MAVKAKAKAREIVLKSGRERMVMPGGAILNLAGLDQIQGYGDDMQIPNMCGDIKIDAGGPSALQTGPMSGGGKIEHISPKMEVGLGKSQVFIQPLHWSGAMLNGLPSEAEEMGVVLGQRRYFFNIALMRGESGQWSPMRGVPAKNQWYVVDADGCAQHPDIVKQVFDPLLKGVELYFRANVRDFALAELAWFNNAIYDYEFQAEKVRLGVATVEDGAEFYRARFSGKMKSLRSGEECVVVWLKDHPAPERGPVASQDILR